MNRVSEGGEESKETKVKKSLRISTNERTTHTPTALLLSVASGIAGEKTKLENKRQAMGREKVCRESNAKTKKSPESVIKDKERKRADEAGLLSLMYP